MPGGCLPEVGAARRRGVRFDIGNGRIAHITWEVAERAIRSRLSARHDLVGLDRCRTHRSGVRLPERAVEVPPPRDADRSGDCEGHDQRGTTFPAFKDLGTLRVGAPADVTVLEQREGRFEFVDNANTPRTGRYKLFTAATVIAGKPVRPA